MRTFRAFYESKSILVQASSTYDAQQKAAVIFKVKPKKQYMISICPVDEAGVTDITSAVLS